MTKSLRTKLAGPCAAAVLLVLCSPTLGHADEEDTCPGPRSLTERLQAGDGPGAAVVIESCGYQRDAVLLGTAINDAGAPAVDAGRGHQYADAVAHAFPHSGVPLTTVTQAFAVGAVGATTAGLTPQQAAIGAETIAKTYAAYLG